MESEVSCSGPEITPHPTTSAARVVTKQQIKEEDKENIIEQPKEVFCFTFFLYFAKLGIHFCERYLCVMRKIRWTLFCSIELGLFKVFDVYPI